MGIDVFCLKLYSLDQQITDEGTVFILEHPMDGRGKWLFAWYAVSFLVPASFGFYLAAMFYLSDGFEIPILVMVGFSLICLILGFRYMASAWRKDTLLVTTAEIILTEQKGFQKKQQSFSRSGVTALRFLEKPELTPHPLAGKTFDYLGFQVQDQVINEMFGDHRVAFNYEGRTISFGRKLFSWDYEAIREALFGAEEKIEEELPWDVASSHEGYWTAYDAFVATIRLEKKYIRDAAEDARVYVSALADGWDEHLDALKELLVRYEDQLTVSQRTQLQELIETADEKVRS